MIEDGFLHDGHDAPALAERGLFNAGTGSFSRKRGASAPLRNAHGADGDHRNLEPCAEAEK